ACRLLRWIIALRGRLRCRAIGRLLIATTLVKAALVITARLIVGILCRCIVVLRSLIKTTAHTATHAPAHIIARAITAAIQHLHFAGDNFGGVAISTVLRLPFAG